jgi:hypothetical protein
VRSLEIAALLFFALLGMARLVGWYWATEHAVAVSFAGLGLFSLGGAALGTPWTAEYARADYGDVVETREFIINSTITVIRGAIFLFFALSQLLSLGVWAYVAGGAVGGFASILGPRMLCVSSSRAGWGGGSATIGRRRRSAARAAMGRMMLRCRRRRRSIAA